jgi:hypothetical protein
VSLSKYSIEAVVPVARTPRPQHPYANGLPDNVRIEDRGSDGVWLVESPAEQTITGTNGQEKKLQRPDAIESRVDSREDASRRAAGQKIWFDGLLAAAKSK